MTLTEEGMRGGVKAPSLQPFRVLRLSLSDTANHCVQSAEPVADCASGGISQQVIQHSQQRVIRDLQT